MALLLRRRSAAVRRLVWTAAAAAVLALPFLSLSLPILPVRAPAALSSEGRVIFHAASSAAAAESPRAGTSTSVAPRQPASWSPDWRLYLMLFWAAGSMLALGQTVAACVAMSRLRRKSKPSL